MSKLSLFSPRIVFLFTCFSMQSCIKSLIITALLAIVRFGEVCHAQEQCSQLTNVRVFAQTTTALASPQAPVRLQTTFRINANRFRGNAENPSASFYINGSLLIGSQNNGLRRIGGIYPELEGFIEGTEYWELTPQNSAWYKGAGLYHVEWVLGVDNDLLNCRRIVRSAPLVLSIATTATAIMPVTCTILTTIATTLQTPSAISATTPIRYTGFFRINAEKFRSNSINPRSITNINGIPLSTFSPHGWRYISGEYPVRNGFLEATEFFEITPKGSAWFRGTGTYTIEYLLDLDTDDVNCSRQARSIPVSVRIEDTQITSNRVETKVYPNPASNELTVNIALSQTMLIECSIVDMLGRKQADICNGQYQSGVFRFMQPLSQHLRCCNAARDSESAISGGTINALGEKITDCSEENPAFVYCRGALSHGWWKQYFFVIRHCAAGIFLSVEQMVPEHCKGASHRAS